MKHRFIFLLAAVVLVSCNRRIKGNGDFIEESRTAGSFTSVVSAGDFDVILTPGATGSIKIYGESNIVSRIKTEVDGGELTINFSNSSRRYEHDGVKIYVTSNGVSNVDLQGSGSIVSEDNLMANSLHT
ncbi:MAG TPA: DUF2807 domain-containing protein, partial [Chitinophagales bacterium]|nr:DUF2807 domain-containing protein [Chitinophagales bacterium]